MKIKSVIFIYQLILMRCKASFFVIALIVSGDLPAQVLSDFSGRVYLESKTAGVQGSPYLFDEWRGGTVLFKNGTRVDNIRLKFDAERNKFLYNHNDSLYEFIDELAEVKIYDETPRGNDSLFAMIFKNNITTGNKLKQGDFVQVLCNGKVTLVKQYIKKPEGENRNEGYNSTVKQYVMRTNVWAVKNDQLIPIKFSANFLEELTSDKKKEVDNYIKANKLNIKSERGFVSAVSYYNLISKQ